MWSRLPRSTVGDGRTLHRGRGPLQDGTVTFAPGGAWTRLAAASVPANRVSPFHDHRLRPRPRRIPEDKSRRRKGYCSAAELPAGQAGGDSNPRPIDEKYPSSTHRVRGVNAPPEIDNSDGLFCQRRNRHLRTGKRGNNLRTTAPRQQDDFGPGTGHDAYPRSRSDAVFAGLAPLSLEGPSPQRWSCRSRRVMRRERASRERGRPVGVLRTAHGHPRSRTVSQDPGVRVDTGADPAAVSESEHLPAASGGLPPRWRRRTGHDGRVGV